MLGMRHSFIHSLATPSGIHMKCVLRVYLEMSKLGPVSWGQVRDDLEDEVEEYDFPWSFRGILESDMV